jgi:hypothetical protein
MFSKAFTTSVTALAEDTSYSARLFSVASDISVKHTEHHRVGHSEDFCVFNDDDAAANASWKRLNSGAAVSDCHQQIECVATARISTYEKGGAAGQYPSGSSGEVVERPEIRSFNGHTQQLSQPPSQPCSCSTCDRGLSAEGSTSMPCNGGSFFNAASGSCGQTSNVHELEACVKRSSDSVSAGSANSKESRSARRRSTKGDVVVDLCGVEMQLLMQKDVSAIVPFRISISNDSSFMTAQPPTDSVFRYLLMQLCTALLFFTMPWNFVRRQGPPEDESTIDTCIIRFCWPFCPMQEFEVFPLDIWCNSSEEMLLQGGMRQPGGARGTPAAPSTQCSWQRRLYQLVAPVIVYGRRPRSRN